jgi:2-methylcitrate dehydratase PrpD
MTQSITMKLGQYAASTAFAKIPAEIRERAKLVIIDEIACGQFGRRSVAGGLAARYVVSLGGPAEARILGTDQRVPAPYAALANGTAGHGEEVDGAHVVGGHAGATIVHAALAVGERQRVSGAELINAVVLGYDLGTRAVKACGGVFVAKGRHHMHVDFLYSVGAAAAASRLLGLDAVRHCHSQALVTFQANGLCALFQEKRHISKSFSNGQYAYAGVSAALMAAAGLEGYEDTFGARDGLLAAWGVEDGAAVLTGGLGEDFTITGANFKFVNAGYPIHAVVEAAMTVVREHGIVPANIEAVHVGMPGNAMRVVDNRDMHNICVQDMLTAALLLGGLSLSEEPFPAILRNPGYASMRARITVGTDPGLERDLPNGRGANVTIVIHGGQSWSHRVDWPRGHSQRGAVTWDDLSGKWHGALPGCSVDHMITLGQELEHIEDVRVLADAFAQSPLAR